MNFQTLATITGLATSTTIALATLPAQAVTLTVEGSTCDYCVQLGEVYDASGGGVLAPAQDQVNAFLTPGSDDGTLFDAVDDSDNVESYNVTSILNNPVGAVNDIVVENLDGAFDFFWGSVDTYNLIEFFDGDTVVASFSGTDIAEAIGFTAADANGSGNFGFDAYVSFEGLFDSAQLSIIPDVGAGIAFEVATEKQAVPEPASLLGLAVVGMVGGGSLLKRSKEA
jgi:hypothetical protein